MCRRDRNRSLAECGGSSAPSWAHARHYFDRLAGLRPGACCLTLFAVTVIGIVGFNVSPHGYAWLFVSITFGSGLADVAVGSAAGPLHRGRAHRRGGDRHFGRARDRGRIGQRGGSAHAATARLVRSAGEWAADHLHAIRAGAAVAVMPLCRAHRPARRIANGGTLAALLATPVLADLEETHRRIVDRGLQRVFGCFVGGLPALALLGASFSVVLPWLIALAVGVWLFAYVQHGTHDVTYLGTQAGVVFISTLVRARALRSVLPGIDRFTGILLGLLMLFVAMFLIGPPNQRPTDCS